MPVRVGAVGDYIRLNATGAPTFTNYTIIWWEQVVTDNAGTDRTSYALQEATTFANMHRVTRTADDVDRLANDATNAALSANLSTTEWVMWAVTCAGTGAGDLKVYAWNASDADGAYESASLAGVAPAAIDFWCLGSNNGFSEYRNARYCFPKIWDAVLSLAELQAERVQGKPVRTSNVNRYHRLETNTDTADYSGNSRTATLNGLDTEGTEPVPWEVGAALFGAAVF